MLIYNVGKTEGWEAPEAGRPASPGPPGLPRAARPKETVFGPRTQLTDLEKQSGASIRRRCPRGGTPRPTGLGEAVRITGVSDPRGGGGE